VIRAAGLTKSYGGVRVVDDVTFEVDAGEFVALLGPSGGGKSTVLRILSGLEVPDAGSVYLRGVEVTEARVQDRALGFVFQHYALFRHMTVHQNVAFALDVRKLPKREIEARVAELLDLVQLRGYEGRYPSQLSGGQRQRVALARALAARPSILLLDEPFGALDAKVRLELRRWLRRLQRDQGITSIFVTHDQEEAMELADRVVIIAKGKVEQIGTPADVYDKPASPFVASFMGSTNVVRRTVGGADVAAYVRHHEVDIVGRAGRADGGEELPSAKVVRVARVGWVVKIELELPNGDLLIAEMPKDRQDELRIQEREEVLVRLRETAVFADDYVI
jgi:sulfate transport system ATP-binding protein